MAISRHPRQLKKSKTSGRTIQPLMLSTKSQPESVEPQELRDLESSEGREVAASQYSLEAAWTVTSDKFPSMQFPTHSCSKLGKQGICEYYVL